MSPVALLAADGSVAGKPVGEPWVSALKAGGCVQRLRGQEQGSHSVADISDRRFTEQSQEAAPKRRIARHRSQAIDKVDLTGREVGAVPA